MEVSLLQLQLRKLPKTWVTIAVTVALALPAVALSTPAGADPDAPWDGTPVSQGLGPTYGEPWCAEAAPGSSIANQQGFAGPAPDTLALMPQEAIGCTLEQFLAEADALGLPERMSYSVIGQSAGGRDMYGVVVNAMETWAQRRDYRRWQMYRSLALTKPSLAQSLLDRWGEDVKLPIFIEANIHGGEEEGADAIMQAIRDLVTTPYGVNAIVDALLDHAIVIVIPSENPDGRFLGTRGNANGIDMNRDFLVQSQSEVRAEIAFQLRWLAPVGLAMHCCGNPTLIDGLTKPHNPGIDYDLFAYWNQLRLDANEAAHNAIGREIQRPVNDYDANGDFPGTPPIGPAYAEGWDDWGPFYTQTYMAFYGVDSSTVEMCSTTCDGRIGSKTAQYITFYSSAQFWVENRSSILHDQAEIYRRGLTGAARPNCCDNPLLVERGFDEANHDWMVPYPKAFVIPFEGTGQRSDAEANRMAEWLLDNGIRVSRTLKDVYWQGQRFSRGSYVVWMKQPFRGLALTTLDPGQDISDRISQLYAPPGAWGHGQMWGADVVEIPADTMFKPFTVPISAPNPLQGGVRPGHGKVDWYSVALRGPLEVAAVVELLRSGVDAEVAEASFHSLTGGTMPAGSLIFAKDPGTVGALNSTGKAVGIWFERNKGPKPPTTALTEVPRIAILVNSAAPTNSDTSQSLREMFGADADFVSVLAGTNSLQNAATDPLQAFDVIYNVGQNYPGSATIAAAPTGATQVGTTVTITTTGSHNLAAGSTVTVAGVAEAGYNGTFTVTSAPTSTTFTYEAAVSGLLASGGGTVTYDTARSRLQAFFAGGGGYIGTSQNANNFAFLTGAGLVTTPLTQGSDSAGGGLALWDNVGGLASPVTGAYPARDYLYLPSSITYFSAVPADAVVDGRYLPDTTALFVAGLWLDRDPLVASAAMAVHGNTTLGSRYVGLATNPFSRMDAEREWLLIGQAAFWSNLTDEA
jgi:hypothetical protein